MGISSNQARLMTLSSRQHDLELRAQNISAQKMIKAMQSQEMATKYSDALNDYSMMKSGELTKTSGKTGRSTVSSSSSNLTISSSARRVSMATQTQSATVVAQARAVSTAQIQLTQAPQATLTLASNLKADTFVSSQSEAGGTTLTNSRASLSSIGSSKVADIAADTIKLDTTIVRDRVLAEDVSGLRSQLQIVDGMEAEHGCREFVFDEDYDFGLDDDTSSSSSSNVSNQDSVKYTKEECDDFLRKAQNEYDTETAKLSAEEKRLDMELTQINTEHSAVTTEYDSVKSLIKDNTDKSFNIFG